MPHAMTEDHAHDESEIASRSPVPLMPTPPAKRRGDVGLRLVEPAKARSITTQPSSKAPIKLAK